MIRKCPKCNKPFPPHGPCPHCALASTPEPPKSAAALRAERWREEQKSQDPDFNKKEAARKKAERAELERQEQLKQLIGSGEFPLNLTALRRMVGGSWFIKDAPRGKGLIVTGGYDQTKLEIVTTEQQRAKGGSSIPAKPVGPVGQGPNDVMTPEPEPTPDNLNYVEIRPREVRAMRQFIRNLFDSKPMMVCLIDDEQIAPEFSYAAGFNHLYEKHPERFRQMIDGALAACQRRCKQDHEQLLRSYEEGRSLHIGTAVVVGKYSKNIYCRDCRKWLNRPTKPERSDKMPDLPNAA